MHCTQLLSFWDYVDECLDGSYRVSYSSSRGKNGGVCDAETGNVTARTFFSSGSDWILWASPELIESFCSRHNLGKDGESHEIGSHECSQPSFPFLVS